MSALAGLIVQDFASNAHRKIRSVMLTLDSDGNVIDPTTVGARPEARGQLEDAGGVGYLREILNDTCSSENTPAYAEIVRAQSMRRQATARITEARMKAMRGAFSIAEIISELSATRERLADEIGSQRERFPEVRSAVPEAARQAHERRRNDRRVCFPAAAISVFKGLAG